MIHPFHPGTLTTLLCYTSAPCHYKCFLSGLSKTDLSTSDLRVLVVLSVVLVVVLVVLVVAVYVVVKVVAKPLLRLLGRQPPPGPPKPPPLVRAENPTPTISARTL